MWFRMPEGCGGITVEQQEFSIEFKDANGVCYFRAPDHFSPRILSMSGFASVDQPEGALADLPKADPLRDGAIAELTQSNQSLKIEMQNLRSDLVAAHAKLASLNNDKTELEKKLREALANADVMKEHLEDAGEAVVPIRKAK